MLDWITDPGIWMALVTLTLLEVVLGIDNVIFISIISGKVPPDQQGRARATGLALAMFTRILLLLSLGWVMGLKAGLFRIPFMAGDAGEISGRDLILILGGLFLVFKSTREIHDSLEGAEGHASARVPATFGAVITQIILLDIVFSLDSVITAVGMANDIPVMVAAVVIAVMVMLRFAGPISRFVEAHPTVKMLALAFLVLIGVNLLADGFAFHIPKGYTYFAMAFSLAVETLNIRLRARGRPVRLHHPVE